TSFSRHWSSDVCSSDLTTQQQDLHQPLKAAIELELERLLPKTTMPPFDLHRAMHYALLTRGKRLRPLLTLFAAGDNNPSPDLLQIGRAACRRGVEVARV